MAKIGGAAIESGCGATGKEFARYWIHNGFVQINQEKMSKSLGNFFTIREIFEKSDWSEAVTGEMLRYFLLSTHYHGPLDFSDQALKEAKNALNGFYDLFARLAEPGAQGAGDAEVVASVERCRSEFRAAMDDDFNTPMAIAALQGFRSEVNKQIQKGLSRQSRSAAREAFNSLGNVLGLFRVDTWQFNPVKATGMDRAKEVAEALARTVGGDLTDEQVQVKLDERVAAKKRKDFKRADEIRAELKSMGITIEDKPDGTSRWKR